MFSGICNVGFICSESKTEEQRVETTMPEKSATKTDILKKMIKASNKPKSAILLPMGMPSKRGRGQAVALKPTSTTPRLQRILQKSSAKVSQDTVLSVDSPRKQPLHISSDILAEEKNIVNKNYYKDILDHDYCQNVPKLENKPQTGPTCDPRDILDLEDGEIMDEFDIVEKDGNQSMNVTRENPHLKENASRKEENAASKSCVSTQRGMRFGARNYRKRDECPFVEEEDKYFDKIPSYYTVLSLNGVKQSKSKKENVAPKENTCGGISIQDYFEPNPTPQGDNSVYSRLPAYHSCFTNSTKYDTNDVSMESKSSSGYSSRSRSPNVSRRSSSRSNSCSSAPRSRDLDRRGRRRKRSGTYSSISRSRSRSYGSSYSR